MATVRPTGIVDGIRNNLIVAFSIARTLGASCCCWNGSPPETPERSIARQRLLDAQTAGDTVEVSASASSRAPIQSASELKATVSEPLEGLPQDKKLEERKCDSRMSLLDYDETCPTCLEPYTVDNPKIVAQCGHHFHLPCIYDWLERSSTCPICGRPMVFETG